MLNPYTRLSELARLLSETFPDGPPRVTLEADDRYALRNGAYVLRGADELLERRARTPADVAQILLATEYADALRKYRCLELQSDVSWRPCPPR